VHNISATPNTDPSNPPVNADIVSALGLTDPAILAFFTGSGNAGLSVTVTGNSHDNGAGGSFEDQFATNATAFGSVTYNYDQNNNSPSAPEPASLLLAGLRSGGDRPAAQTQSRVRPFRTANLGPLGPLEFSRLSRDFVPDPEFAHFSSASAKGYTDGYRDSRQNSGSMTMRCKSMIRKTLFAGLILLTIAGGRLAADAISGKWVWESQGFGFGGGGGTPTKTTLTLQATAPN